MRLELLDLGGKSLIQIALQCLIQKVVMQVTQRQALEQSPPLPATTHSLA